MGFVIGIDGGGTKTLAKAADMAGNMLCSLDGGPANINSAGIMPVEKMLLGLIGEVLKKVHMSVEDLRAICIGTAGADRPDEKGIIKDIIRGTGFSGRIIVTNDAEIALYGGTHGREGIIIISGTGSICYGRNSSGDICRAGGWGHIIGDEGSGYDMGVKALKCIMRSFDGRDKYTILTPMVLDFLKLKSPEDLINYIYRSGAGKSEISGIAGIVNTAFQSGDECAEKILKESAFELFLCAKSVMEKLSLTDKPVQVAASGSVLANNNYIFKEFSALMEESYPMADIGLARDDPAWGAVLMALKKSSDLEGDYAGQSVKD